MHDFIKWNEDDILESAIQSFEQEANEELYAGDERRLILNTFMYIATIIANKINYETNQNFVSLMDEEHLLLRASELGMQRIEAEYAKTVVRFSLSVAKNYDISIPLGTRVTPDGKLYFATNTNNVISAGSTYVDISCIATIASADHNDFAVGTITTLVDNINYIASVSNIVKSTGGRNIESLEELRTRIKLKPYSYSTAGSTLYYKSLILNSFADVSSLSVLSKADNESIEEGTVLITIVKGGGIPDSTYLAEVESYLSDPSIKPQCDNIIVQAPVASSYEINTAYTIAEEDTQRAEEILTNITIAVNTFKATYDYKIGKSINPELLRKAMLNAGAYTVNITSPSYVSIDNEHVSVCSSVTIINSGIYSEV